GLPGSDFNRRAISPRRVREAPRVRTPNPQRFARAVMTDIAALEGELIRMVETAADESALEAVRVAALGKKGSISALLATLGKMSPDERKENGPLINGLKDRIGAVIAARREALKSAALEARLAA